MRVLHVPFTYAPDPMGGTEVYVARLAESLLPLGVESAIAAPGKPGSYLVAGTEVHRFGCSPSLALPDLYGPGDPNAAAGLGEIIDRVKPDLLHFHALTSASSLRAQEEALRRKLPVVFTYHTPTTSCQRGTLLLDGRSTCDGEMRGARCTACTLQAHGLGSVPASYIARVPQSIQEAIAGAGFSGRLWTALQMRSLVEARHLSVRTFLARCDAVVITARWVADLFERNNLAVRRLAFSRQGVPAPARPIDRASTAPGGTLRIAWIGRLHPTKGLHVLLEALTLVPDLKIQLDAYAIAEGGEDSYARSIRALVECDSRVRLRPAVAPAEVLQTASRYHLVAVPSQCLETGPIVVLEAFAAHVPVIGSALGGISELVKHRTNGLLVEASDRKAWAMAISALYHDRTEMCRMSERIEAPRMMGDVARDMVQLYGESLMSDDATDAR